MTPDTFYGLRQRAVLVQAIREFFNRRDYLEVATPVRIPAPAPEAHILPEPAGAWYLQTSPELCMKRLLAAGIPRIFQICPCFRHGERGQLHLPEFTLLEWYRAGIDYGALMDECEELVCFCADRLGLGKMIAAGAGSVSLDDGFERLTVADAFARHATISPEQALAADIFDEILVRDVEPRLGMERPTFLQDYPAELGALARLKADEPGVAERFELYINGMELANGFSELADAAEQRRRFVLERERMAALGRPPGPMPEPFLRELPAMGPAAGIALGVERLVMVLAGIESIDQVVAFTPEAL